MTVGKFVYFICSHLPIEINNFVIYCKLCQANRYETKKVHISSQHQFPVVLTCDLYFIDSYVIPRVRRLAKIRRVSIYVITNVINVP